jgi:hypothetical protein
MNQGVLAEICPKGLSAARAVERIRIVLLRSSV